MKQIPARFAGILIPSKTFAIIFENTRSADINNPPIRRTTGIATAIPIRISRALPFSFFSRKRAKSFPSPNGLAMLPIAPNTAFTPPHR